MAKKLPEPPRTDLAALEEVWGCAVDPDLLALALVHRSWANEAGGTANNERLEFLGDAVLSIVVAERVFHEYPDVDESTLSRMRAATVSQEPLARSAREVGLGDFIYLGRGEDKTGGRDKDSILSDTFEALVGATFLTHGFAKAREIVLDRLSALLDAAPERAAAQDWKSTLHDMARERGLGEVTYEVTGEGPDHDRRYEAVVTFSEREGEWGRGRDHSKKHAENRAAREAVLRLDPDFLSR